MQNINLKIDNVSVSVPKGTSILNAARKACINIPTLCYHPDLTVRASCRVCLVEIKGSRKLVTACSTPVKEGMEVFTTTAKVKEARKTVLELILANHKQECLTCPKNNKCELQKLTYEYNIKDIPFEDLKDGSTLPIDNSSSSIVRDPNKCIKCGRCVDACLSIQAVGAIGNINRSFELQIGTPFEKPLGSTACINCGRCITVCPVGALYEKDDTEKVWNALSNPDLHVVVETAPAVRVGLGEEFGMEKGTPVVGKMVAALRRLGFDKVFDTDFAADLTILEEGTELINRIKNNGRLPLITSCSPGWIKFCEHNFPEFLDNLSSCKSPQQMFGAIAKSYYAKKAGIDPSKIFVVSVMPCTAKKFECKRPELASTGYPDVDVVLTTRELAKMIREASINFTKLEDEAFDSILGESTGAAVIFGATGGVMEAALRTVAEVVTGKELQNIDFTAVRGLDDIKEAEVVLGDLKVKVAVAHGTANAKALLEKIKRGEASYHFIEIMACPGGCINGGGQPFVVDKSETKESKISRLDSIYNIDRSMPVRKSHMNEEVKTLYKEFLGEPNSHKAHDLLHTQYTTREKE